MIRNFKNEVIKLYAQKLPQIAVLILLIQILLYIYKIGGGSEASRNIGFETLSGCIKISFNIAVIFVLLVSLTSISREISAGTIRTILVKPITRFEFFTSKCLALLAFSLMLWLIITFLPLILIYLKHGFGDIVDKEFVNYIHISKGTMFSYFILNSLMLLGQMITVMFFGIFLSTIFTNNSLSLMIAISLNIMTNIISFSKFASISPYLFNSYSGFYLSAFNSAAGGSKIEIWKFDCILNAFSGSFTPEKIHMILLSLIIPISSSIIFYLSSLTIFKRKDILS